MPQPDYIVEYCLEKYGIAWVEWDGGLTVSPLAWYDWASSIFDWLQLGGGLRLKMIG